MTETTPANALPHNLEGDLKRLGLNEDQITSAREEYERVGRNRDELERIVNQALIRGRVDSERRGKFIAYFFHRYA